MSSCQTLLVVARDLDIAIAHGEELQHELNLYKSAAVPQDMRPRTNITRVGRVPLAAHSTNTQLTSESAVSSVGKTDMFPINELHGMTLDEIM